jgi:hypothetical protein
MLDKEIFGLDMFGTFGAGCTAILLEGESTHVVLENDIFINSVALSFKEMASPQNIF